MSTHPADNLSPAHGQPLADDCASLYTDNLVCSRTSFSRPVSAHRHDLYLIAFVLSGSGLHEDQTGRLPILASDVCVLAPHQWHRYPRVHGELTVLNLAMTASYLDICVPVLGEMSWLGLPPDTCPSRRGGQSPPAHVRLSPREMELFQPLLLALCEEFKESSDSSGRAVRAGLLLQILGLLDRSTRRRAHADAGDVSHQDDGIASAIRYLEERYMGPLAIEELAAATGYTPTYLTRKFRHRLGMSPSEYLLNLRMQHACLLLRETQLSIASIAHDVGFRDSQYFSTRFHHVVGTTPSAFRARLQPESRPS